MSFECTNEITIVCPFCGYRYPDPLEEAPGEEDIGELECSRCGKTFVATREILITYTTQKMKQRIS